MEVPKELLIEVEDEEEAQEPEPEIVVKAKRASKKKEKPDAANDPTDRERTAEAGVSND